MPDLNRLRDEILSLLKAEVKDLWDKEDIDFLQQLATDLAREKLLAAASDDPQEHEKNLQHLAAILQGEVARRQLQLNQKGQDLFVRVVGLVIKTVALPPLGVII
ncbi:MAG: hypothetical protein JRI57_01000 [Deltaproteobacteria bacterium]|nr:hypothetical protein [Deltaproteobacteria bacterium]MBW1952396.1 hypothetical protein [Deltaproteobacteria bacterium]MBW1985907.1 hypothetical protein [Deltaproteobacteria bacterium]MBW2133667.1 hypothetical protein [Deltaproteobacteria bacterium]